MLENKWARDYLRGLFENQSKGTKDVDKFVSASGFNELDDPLLEISFLRQSASSVKCQRLSIAALALCGEDAPISLVSELIETVESCNSKMAMLVDELPRLKEAVRLDAKNGEKLAHLGFALLAANERETALSAFTQALEWPATLCIHCHRDCLVNIGWDHYLQGEYEQALGWFEHACHLRQPHPYTERQNHLGIQPQVDSDAPYQLALENVLLTLAKMGRLNEAIPRLEEYHRYFGRLPTYESRALEKLGLQPDVIYIRSCIDHAAGTPQKGSPT